MNSQVSSTFANWPGLVVTSEVASRSIRVMPQRSMNFPDHLRAHGDQRMPKVDFASLVEMLDEVGLNGRGGAGFPTAKKLASMASYVGKAVVVANGSESEPLAHKDESLLIHQPHLVLEGISIVAGALGAQKAYLMAKTKNQMVVSAVEAALRERRKLKLDKVPVTPRIADAGYTSGVETSIIQQLNGKGPKPAFFPDRPIVTGVSKKPTFISNVETYATIALIGRAGASFYRSMGVPGGPFGSQLLTVVSQNGSYLVVEAEVGTPLSEIISLAQVDVSAASSVLMGGYFGQIVKPESVIDLKLNQPEMKKLGLGVGAGIIGFSNSCPILEASGIVAYLASQTAGQCGPCFLGLPALAKEVGRLAHGATMPKGVEEIGRLADQIVGRGGCAMPDGAVIIARSIMRNFPDEVRLHESGRCSFPKGRANFFGTKYERLRLN